MVLFVDANVDRQWIRRVVLLEVALDRVDRELRHIFNRVLECSGSDARKCDGRLMIHVHRLQALVNDGLDRLLPRIEISIRIPSLPLESWFGGEVLTFLASLKFV